MKPIAYLVSAALLVLAPAACGGGGAKSAGPVPTIPSAAERVAFIGLPPKGAEPSNPKRGELVASWWGTAPGDWGKSRFWLFADGRLISLREADIPEGANPSSTGFLEQRVTPEGVELLRSEIVGSDPRRATGDVTSELPKGDVTSELPKRAWADRAIRAYVPSRYAVCGDVSSRPIERLWAPLPARAKDVLRGNEIDRARSMEPIEYCWDVTTKEARALADALDDAGLGRNPHDKPYRLGYTLKGPEPSDPMDEARAAIYLSFEPILPNGEWTCSPCG